MDLSQEGVRDPCIITRFTIMACQEAYLYVILSRLQEMGGCEPLPWRPLDKSSFPVLGVLLLAGQDTEEPQCADELHCPSSSTSSSPSSPTNRCWGHGGSMMFIAGCVYGANKMPVTSLLFWGCSSAELISTLPKWQVLVKLWIDMAEGSLTHFCWTGTDSVKTGQATTSCPKPCVSASSQPR